MQAIFRTTYGSADVLELKEIDKPLPKDNEVLVRVRAASVNPLDWHVLRGEPFLVRLMGFGIMKPKHLVLGADMAGRIEAVGHNVTRFKVGDEVFGSGMGGFAEYACIREDHATFKPPTVSFEQAAAVPVAGLTALQALRDHGRIQEGHHVLINGASGGVGTFAVQIARALGAQVTGVCSTHNLELVRSIGAQHAIDYTKEDYWARGKQYDLIVDNASFQPISGPLQALKASGIYVGVGGSSSTVSVLQSMIFDPVVARFKGKKVVSFVANVNQADLEFMKKLLENGKIVPAVERTYCLNETPQAISHVEQGHTRGKVVVTV